jgi:serine/threonine protein kinase/tetratricopeptide (TPR) repeat protein
MTMNLELSNPSTLDEEARRQFEAAWKQRQPQSIEMYLPPPTDSRYLATLEELVQIELEFLWRGRQNRPNGDTSAEPTLLIEEYLQRFPCLEQPATLRRLLEHEYHVRRLFGDTPVLTEYQKRFPYLVRTGGELGVTLALGESSLDDQPKIPGYQILDLLGRGGMGVVYKARQTSLNRLVALKMIVGGVPDSAGEVSRFRREAEAVARLQHPNIVQVHEVGEVRGRPYFSMELIEGGTLAQRLAGTPQSAHASAELIETLARAVHHAHTNGVIHRDLKPANILLVSGGVVSGGWSRSKIQGADEHGQPPINAHHRSLTTHHSPLTTHHPKITDFGLAKMVDTDGSQTTTGTPLGTPSYMAPEQVIGKRDEIGPATDVYGLGAILYEMLTGRPPFRADTPMGTLEQVRTQEPMSPSRLALKIPRDLITICLKCLEKDPCRRYPTAETLADDLRRFLDGKPIYARPTPAWERTWKWAKRRPAVSTLAGTGIAAVIAIIAVILSANSRLQAQRDVAERRRAEATANLRKAREAVDELTQVAQEELTRLPKVAPVKRKILEKALRFYQDLSVQTGDDPDMRYETSRAHRRLAIINCQLGQIDQAEPHFRKAVALSEKLAAEYPTNRSYQQELAKTNHNLGHFLGAEGFRTLLPAGKEIEAYFLRAIAVGEGLIAKDSADASYLADLGWTYNSLGIYFDKRKRNDERIQAYRRAHELITAAVALDPSNIDYFDKLTLVRNNLAEKAQDPKEAEKLFRQNLEPQFPNGIPPHLALTYEMLSEVLRKQGKPSEARSFLRKAADMRQKEAEENPELPGGHLDSARALKALASFAVTSGDYVEVRRDLEKAIGYRRVVVKLMPNNTDCLNDLISDCESLVDTLTRLGDRDGAAKVTAEVEHFRERAAKRVSK